MKGQTRYMSSYLPRARFPAFVLYSIAGGLATGVAWGLLGSFSQGFALWLGLIGGVIGAVTGLVGFLLGAAAFIACRSLPELARRIVVSAISCGGAVVTVGLIMSVTHAVGWYGPLHTAFAGLYTLVVAFIVYPRVVASCGERLPDSSRV